jgi:hypothetical protein
MANEVEAMVKMNNPRARAIPTPTQHIISAITNDRAILFGERL